MSRPMSQFVCLILSTVFVVANPVAQEYAESAQVELKAVPGNSVDETVLAEWKELLEGYDAANDAYHREGEAIAKEKFDDEEFSREWTLRDPRNSFAQRFLDFEERYRGTAVGLSCLQKSIINAAGFFEDKWPATAAKKVALPRLASHYFENPDLDLTFRYLSSGPFVIREIEDCFHGILEKSPYPHVRGMAAARLAEAEINWGVAKSEQSAGRLLSSLAPETDPRVQEQMKRIGMVIEAVDADACFAEAERLLALVETEYAGELVSPRFDLSLPIVAADRGPSDVFSGIARQTLREFAAGQRQVLANRIGQPVTDIQGPDVNGMPMKLSDFRGKVTVLMFSYKGCGPCEAMYPDNRKLIEEMQGKPFAFVGVQKDENPSVTLETIQSGDITWPVWFDTGEATCRKWGIRGFPSIYVIDARGIIRFRGLRHEDLAVAVRYLLAEAESGRN